MGMVGEAPNLDVQLKYPHTSGLAMVGRPVVAALLFSLTLVAAVAATSSPTGGAPSPPSPVTTTHTYTGTTTHTWTTSSSPPTEQYVRGMVCVGNEYSYEPYMGCQGPGIPYATVRVWGNGFDRTLTTDEWGNYFIESLPVATYTLSATRTGFEAAELRTEPYGPFDISLQPLKVEVRGRVTDIDGNPVAEAELSFCCSTPGVTVLSSGPDGNFQASLLAGPYTLDVTRAGFARVNMQVFVDGTGPTDVQMQPLPPQDALLQGTVRDQHGNPVAGLILYMEQYECCGNEGYRGQYDCGYGMPGAQGCPEAVTPIPVDYRNRTETDAAGRFRIHAYTGGSMNVHSEDSRYSPFWDSVWIDSPAVTHDIQVIRYPERDHPLTGRVVDAVTGRGIASYSVQVEGLEFGRYECSEDSRISSYAYGSGYSYAPPPPTASYAYEERYSTYATAYPAPMPASPPYPGHGYRDYPYESGCAIRIQADGSFAGNVTAGYSRIRVHANQQCTETQDAGGGYRRTCGPEYLPYVQSLMLAEGNATKLVIRLQPKPAPDAVVSGYLVDARTKLALPLGHIEFSNDEVPGHGYATTDGDGSYRIRLRSGYHTVTARVPGYFDWQGTILVKSGEMPFDVLLTPGRIQDGGGYPNKGDCCWGTGTVYPMPVECYECAGGGAAVAHSGTHSPAVTYTATYTATTQACNGSNGCAAAPMGAPAPMPGGGVTTQQIPVTDSEADARDSAQGYVDLGGNLGPYDPEARAKLLAAESAPQGSPALGIALVAIGLLVGVVAIRRRL